MPIQSIFLNSVLLCCVIGQAHAASSANNTSVEQDALLIQKQQIAYQAYIPKHYNLFEVISGDLNQDGIQDRVLMVKATDPKAWVEDEYKGKFDRNRRGVIILFGQKGRQSYKTVLKNLNCLSSEQEDGGVYFAPELSLSIRKGILQFQYGHGRYGYWGYKFRLEGQDFRLIGFDRYENYGPITQNVSSYNFLTQKKLFKDNLNKDQEDAPERFKQTWQSIRVAPIYLSQIVDFDSLSFENTATQ